MPFKHVKKNKGKAGLDRVSIKQFETHLDENITRIHQELKTAYPTTALRVYIPKGRKGKDHSGIPIVRDIVVILLPIGRQAAGIPANHRADI
ncbi:MAG: hypothetical protein MRJ65_07450 [Candidatus Brocadiaceae bacterium]|nr:hypothetical protein [Candidatus Brocadiaceae bacterium]